MKKSKTAIIFFYVWLGLSFGLVIKLFVLDFLQVKGLSMSPTIKDCSTVVINKLAYGIVRPWGATLLVQWQKAKTGDVVIFLHDNKIVIKRCVATAGDTLAYSSDLVYTEKGYSLYLNGETIPLTKTQWQNLKDFREVPPDTIFVCGDNYKDSVDSRDYGFIKNNCILAKVLFLGKKSIRGKINE